MSYDKKSDIFGQMLRIVDVLLISFEQMVSFCAIIYSNTNSLKLFCEDSSLNSENYTDRAILGFMLIFDNFTPAQKYFTQVSPVTVVTNSESVNMFKILPAVTDFKRTKLSSNVRQKLKLQNYFLPRSSNLG